MNLIHECIYIVVNTKTFKSLNLLIYRMWHSAFKDSHWSKASSTIMSGMNDIPFDVAILKTSFALNRQLLILSVGPSTD